MIRFQCPHCGEIIATETWEPGVAAKCAYCGKKITAPQTRFDAGVVIGDFLIIRRLGAGGMGVVFLAHQISLDRPAAIKVLNPEYSHETESVKAFIREARSAAKLNHPNIVQAYAVGEDEGIFYFAMEFIDGKTMKQVLQEQGKIPAGEACRIIAQVADALDCAWKEQKLIHHDIKPDNIMRCGNNRVKLADLGLSQVYGEDADDDSDEVLGTPQYISPEQLTGTVTDTRSDIYSLGATFYHLVTGRFPYDGENTDEIAKQHLYGTLKPPIEVDPLLPRAVNDIIMKMMARDPAARYQNCGELSKALQDYIAGRGTGSLGGGLGGAKLGGGLGGGLSGGLGGGLSGATLGGLSAQPKVLAPSHVKLSLKTKEAEPPAPVAAPSVPESPKPAAPSAAAPASASGKLSLKSAAATPDAPPSGNAQAGAAQPNPDKIGPSAPGTKPPETAETGPDEKERERRGAEDSAQDAARSVPDEKAPSAAAAGEAGDEEDAAEDDVPGGNVPVWLAAGVILLFLLGGGAAAWFFLDRPASRPVPAPDAPVVIPLVNPAAHPETEVSPVDPQPFVPIAPVTPAVPQLSAFQRELGRLQDLQFSSEAQFLREYPRNTLRPSNEEERNALNTLESAYIDCDERVNVAATREPLIRNFRTMVERRRSAAERAALEAERAAVQAKIRARDEAETARFDTSDYNYQETLPIRKERLDYAMVHALRSGNSAHWQAFKEAVKAARGEPERVKEHPKRQAAAKELADYADMLDAAADQCHFFDAFLANRGAGLRGKGFPFGDSQAIVQGAGRNFVNFTLKPPKGRSVSKRVDLSREQPDPDDVKLIDGVGRLLGRSDLYFYHLLGHGEFQRTPKELAPSDFWRNRAPLVAENYFRRALMLATEKEQEALEKQFGERLPFRNAKKTMR